MEVVQHRYSFKMTPHIDQQIIFISQVNCWQLAARRGREAWEADTAEKQPNNFNRQHTESNEATPERKRQTSLLSSCRGGRTKRRGGTARRQLRPSRVSHLRAASGSDDIRGRLAFEMREFFRGKRLNCCRAEASSLTEALLLRAKFNDFCT